MIIHLSRSKYNGNIGQCLHGFCIGRTFPPPPLAHLQHFNLITRDQCRHFSVFYFTVWLAISSNCPEAAFPLPNHLKAEINDKRKTILLQSSLRPNFVVKIDADQFCRKNRCPSIASKLSILCRIASILIKG